MREIQVQKLTKDNFGKYGEFLDLLDESELKKKSRDLGNRRSKLWKSG